MSSIGQDLSRIRHYQKLTLQDLHKRTRISLAILEKLEEGRLFEDPVENEVYARSYIRTYARALGISEELVTAALDQQKKGEYDGLLLEPWPDIIDKTTPRELPSKEASSESDAGTEDTKEKGGDNSERASNESGPRDADTPGDKPARESDDDSSDSKEAARPGSPTQAGDEPDDPATKSHKPPASDRPDGGTDASSPGGRPASRPKKGVPGAEKAKPESPGATPRDKRTADQVDWAAMGKRFTTPSKRSSGWILGLGLVLLFVAIVLWIAFRTDLMANFFSASEPAQEMVTEPVEQQNRTDSNGDLSLDLGSGVDEDPDPTSSDANQAARTRLDSTLYLTIYGAYGALDPIRVWSDLKPRFDPYWIEQGEAMQFEFRDTLRVRSQYDESLLFLNGHRIDDARDQYYNSAEQSVELTRGLFSPESEWANPRELELPDTVAVPDTIRMRPIFN